MDANTAGNESMPASPQLRIAIVSTPRSGNTWLRRLIASTYALEERAVHNPADLNWAELPTRCVLQIHWHHAEPFLSSLERHRFRAVVLSRHPLDVLISVLHFAPHEPETARWLEGEGGSEAGILGASPRSPAFLEYATGPRAAALLGVSREWWGMSGGHRLRYEDLVRDPARELERLGKSIGDPAAPPTIAQAVAANSMAALRATSHNQHFWRGRPGHWRSLLPAAEARRIAWAHRACFAEFAYECEPDESLDDGRADANWARFRQPRIDGRLPA